MVILFVKFVGNYFKSKGKSFYNISFNEGIEHHDLEIYASDYVEALENSKFLKNMINDKENKEFIYKLSFERKEDLIEFKKKIENERPIKKIEAQIL